jgi:hypothetical protein
MQHFGGEAAILIIIEMDRRCCLGISERSEVAEDAACESAVTVSAFQDADDSAVNPQSFLERQSNHV